MTYTIEGNQICSIIKIGKKQYLDCTGEGETVIVAIQEGNNNYWQSTKVYKTIFIKSAAGVYSVNMDIDENAKIFDASGMQVNNLQKDINILKMSDGTTKKILIK